MFQGAADSSDKPGREDSDAQELANIRSKIRVSFPSSRTSPRACIQYVCEGLKDAFPK